MPSNKKLLQAAAGSAGGDKLFVEDVFSNYLYAGTGSSLAINNGLDLSGEGGLMWLKGRDGAYYHKWYDTERGIQYAIESNTTDANQTEAQGVTAVGSSGFTLGTDGNTNSNGAEYVSWSFRKAAGFCDIVTYTGNDTARTIAHNLGSVPKMIIVKSTSDAYDWVVYHANLTNQQNLNLNTANPAGNSGAEYWNSTTATSSVFSLGNQFRVNGSGKTYVAYVFGDGAVFGEGGDEQICKMGSYTDGGSSSDITVNLGWEPQWLLLKNSTSSGNWWIFDTMRGWVGSFGIGSSQRALYANLSNAGANMTSNIKPTATGFVVKGNEFGSGTYIYMAIRRPMKVPEAGTEVFQALTYSGTGAFPSGTDPNSGVATRTISSSLGFDVDMSITKWRSGGSGTPAPSSSLMDRFRGIYNELFTYDTAAETQGSNTGPRFSTRASRAFDLHDYGVEQLNKSGQALVSYVFKRAPKFMDMVCLTGNGGGTRTITHNLTVAPEIIIYKRRDGSSPYGDWYIQSSYIGAGRYLTLNGTGAKVDSADAWSSTNPTSTVFTIGPDNNVNTYQYIAYLFATLAGISKVGTYTGTGTGTTVNVDCGFSAGARFVLIKRTDGTGNWFAYDSSRGIVAGDSPYLLFNTAAQEVNTDYIDPLSSGFSITPDAAATNTLNVNNAIYIFLAIA